MKLTPYIQLARPKHWVKNVVVFLPVLFGLKFAEMSAWFQAACAAGIFCLAASGIYSLNDAIDFKSDRLHPKKKDRPVASGAVSQLAAIIQSAVLLLSAAILSLFLSSQLMFVVCCYIILHLAYVFILKSHVLVDVICLSLGFVLRAVAGAVAIDVEISPWLFICMFTLFLFMGFCKRYNELANLGSVEQAGSHRKTLIVYTPELLTYLITTSSAIAIVAFLSYSLNPQTIEKFGTYDFVFTLPILVYSIFRFAMVSIKGLYTGPVDIILRDRPFQFSVFLWIVSMIGVLCFVVEETKVLG